MAKLVSKTYGDALFEAATESDALDKFRDEAQAVRAAIADNPDLYVLMSHPKIVKEEKISIIENIFKETISGELAGLLRLLVEKDHFGEVDAVLEYFLERVKEYHHIGTVYVTSALEMDEAQRASVEKRVAETTQYDKLEMHYEVDETLIGGLVIRIGDRVVDGSVRSKLRSLTRELSKIQLKAGECAT